MPHDCGFVESEFLAQPIRKNKDFSAQPENGSGCRQCMRLCQFGALSYSAGSRKAAVDQTYCYGCGICRSVCERNAIRPEERAASPVAHLW